LGNWANSQAIFNFAPGSQPLPLEVHIQSFNAPHFPSLMIQMAKPAYLSILEYAHEKPVICDPQRFLNIEQEDLAPFLAKFSNENSARLWASGIGYCHEAISNTDKVIVQKLFEVGAIQVVALKDFAWGSPKLLQYASNQYPPPFNDPTPNHQIDYPLSASSQQLNLAPPCPAWLERIARASLLLRTSPIVHWASLDPSSAIFNRPAGSEPVAQFVRNPAISFQLPPALSGLSADHNFKHQSIADLLINRDDTHISPDDYPSSLSYRKLMNFTIASDPACLYQSFDDLIGRRLSLGEITIAMIQIDHIQMKLDKGPGTCIRPILEAHLDQNVKTDTAYLTTDQPPTLPGVLLKVDGMTCFPCSSSVKTQFKKLKGIHFVSVALMASFWNFAPKGEDNRDEICFFATRADQVE
ncbi:hypothetical protein PCANC_13844, partial [Puccinia coronata f. sp. avenae]